MASHLRSGFGPSHNFECFVCKLRNDLSFVVTRNLPPSTVALAPLLQRRNRDRFAIVMEEAATQPQGEAKKAIICITRPLLTQYRRRVSKHIGTLVWWRICNRGRLKRFDALIRLRRVRRWEMGAFSFAPAGRKENLPEQLTGPMTVRMRNRRPSSV
jgi:hypothetical protein